MRPRYKYGLIAGGIGLVVNVVVAALMGICGPFISLLAGAAAGFFAARAEKLPVKRDAAGMGAIAGVIAGGLVIVGQVLGGILTLAFVQSTGTNPLIGTVPGSGDAAGNLIYYISGAVVSMCFGLFGAAAAAGAGALAAYFATPESSQVPPPPYPPAPPAQGGW